MGRPAQPEGPAWKYTWQPADQITGQPADQITGRPAGQPQASQRADEPVAKPVVQPPAFQPEGPASQPSPRRVSQLAAEDVKIDLEDDKENAVPLATPAGKAR